MIIYDSRWNLDRPKPANHVEWKVDDLWTVDSRAAYEIAKDVSLLVLNMDTVQLHIERSDSDNVPALFNFEMCVWNVPDVLFARQLAWWKSVWKKIREVNLSMQVGVYSECPAGDYWLPVQARAYWPAKTEWERVTYLRDIKPALAKHRLLNTKLKVLAEDLSFICPSVYLVYEWHDYETQDTDKHWAAYAKWNIAEAAKYRKPVYPVVWPRYHPSSPNTGEVIELSRWKKYIDSIVSNKNVAGIILYDETQLGPYSEVREHFAYVTGLLAT